MFKDPNMLVLIKIMHFTKDQKIVIHNVLAEIQLLCSLQRSVERISAEICVA
jgi:hypothetical protein